MKRNKLNNEAGAQLRLTKDEPVDINPEKNDAVQNQCSEEEIGCQSEDEGEDEEEEKAFPERNL